MADHDFRRRSAGKISATSSAGEVAELQLGGVREFQHALDVVAQEHRVAALVLLFTLRGNQGTPSCRNPRVCKSFIPTHPPPPLLCGQYLRIRAWEKAVGTVPKRLLRLSKVKAIGFPDGVHVVRCAWALLTWLGPMRI